jgi:predicted O-methyltransferase YrrM
MNIAIAPVGEGDAGGQVCSMYWDEVEAVWQVQIKHQVGKHRGTTPIEMQPGEDATLIRASLVAGWITPDEARLLYSYAGRSKGPIVEVGSWQGKSATMLGWGSRLGSQHPVFTVDPHTGSLGVYHEAYTPVGTYGLFSRNIDQAGLLDEWVHPIRKTSLEAAEQFELDSLGLVFIDGDHTMADVDFDAWWPRIMPGGHLLMHDSNEWPDVKAAVEDRMINNNMCEYVDMVDSIAIGRKP